MQRLVCVGDVKASVQQGRCEVLAALPMSADREALVLWLIPRICPALVVQPWLHNQRGTNSWNEPKDKSFTIRGHRKGGKYLASALLNGGFDIAYAYKPLHTS